MADDPTSAGITKPTLEERIKMTKMDRMRRKANSVLKTMPNNLNDKQVSKQKKNRFGIGDASKDGRYAGE